MTLIVNAKYRGRFQQKAIELVKSGVRVGMMWIDDTSKNLHCHVCKKDFSCPKVDPDHKDAFGECTNCKTPFIFAKI